MSHTLSSYKEMVRHKARRHGYQVHIAMCRSMATGCPIAGSWHVAVAGKGRYRNKLSLDEANSLLDEWVAEDNRTAPEVREHNGKE